ncbi:hypothetical protein SUTH_00725 [Sulfuritalea hydrogenivorans sk43H]|uniref:Uncharacterized protein n=2 Tax=Sulfuritalea hydrogenivorans TaxID=748811 RepID=W0SCP9_9PROT|nr:hypothetical protein SUTH_00725 [Sulfuritalea hydrogenivorans sk43H]
MSMSRNTKLGSTRSQTIWMQISLLLLGLMVTVPFLNPIHHHPIPSFYGEWWALVLGLLAATAGLLAAPVRLVLPSILKLPALFLAVVLVQWLAGMIAYPEFALFHIGYLAWAAVIVTMSATLSDRIGRDRLFRSIAAAILVGALLSAGIAFAQRLNLSISPELMFPQRGGRMLGNIAQSNKLGSYLWLGILSVLYLREQKAVSNLAAFVFVLLLGTATGLTGSRMALANGVALVLAACFAYRIGTRSDNRFRISFLLLALAMLLGAKPLFSNLPRTGMEPVSAAERLTESNIGGDARIELWRDTLTIIGDHPWVGNGAGNFPWRMVEAAARAPAGAATHPGAEHSHNIALQVAADFGIPLLALSAAILAIWLFHLRKSRLDGSMCFGLAVLIVWAIHSLLEYPLWYTDALGIFCLVLGAIDPRAASVAYPARRPILPAALAAGVLALMPLRLDYARLDEATNRIPGTPTAADWKQRIDTVADIAKNSGLGSYAYIALGSLLEPEERLAAAQSHVCERAMKLWPDAAIIARCAYLRHLTGRTAEGKELLEMALAAYRDSSKQAAIGTALELAAKKNPGAKAGVFPVR